MQVLCQKTTKGAGISQTAIGRSGFDCNKRHLLKLEILKTTWVSYKINLY